MSILLQLRYWNCLFLVPHIYIERFKFATTCTLDYWLTSIVNELHKQYTWSIVGPVNLLPDTYNVVHYKKQTLKYSYFSLN
jgi:hypothetical protein